MRISSTDRLLHQILEEVRKILRWLTAAQGFAITQLGAHGMAITGIVVGQSGTFQATPQPPGSALEAGNIPVWSADSTDVKLAPSADSLTVVATVAATSTATAFNLTITGVSSNGSSITGSASVPILPVTPPPATSFSIDQIA